MVSKLTGDHLVEEEVLDHVIKPPDWHFIVHVYVSLTYQWLILTVFSMTLYIHICCPLRYTSCDSVLHRSSV